MRTYLLVILLLIPSVAMADRWIPYTDGRVGGCFQNDVTGHLYGCTPQPQRTSKRSEELDLARDDERLRRVEQENIRLREQNFQLEAERANRNAAEQAQRARQQRNAQAIRNIYLAEQARVHAEEDRKREQDWVQSRTGCNSAAYQQKLERMGLQRHPRHPEICVPDSFEAGTGVISAQGCPPC